MSTCPTDVDGRGVGEDSISSNIFVISMNIEHWIVCVMGPFKDFSSGYMSVLSG